jgi:hypothetical protein
MLAEKTVDQVGESMPTVKSEEQHFQHHHHQHGPSCNHGHDHAEPKTATAEPEVDTSPFKIPARAILSVEDMERWKASPTYAAYCDFVQALNSSVKNKKLTEDVPVSKV